MITHEQISEFAKELFGRSCKLTPRVLKYEGNIAPSSAIVLLDKRQADFILIKVSSTSVTALGIPLQMAIRSNNMTSDMDYPLVELNDFDDIILPLKYIRIVNNNTTQAAKIGVFLYGYSVE